ncbi:sugar diacid recognition domain-containing protein [Sporosarcina siberiensis]|uniref:Sugar diacid recognition domain-containing protein n=1 Tax=Sporosarcina siberiensis TaxID=1365606 RepID=A0ABW4SEN9_9BACL
MREIKFFEHIAQSIVEETSYVLNIPISITNNVGTIIGCMDRERLGSHHVATPDITKADQIMHFTEKEIMQLDNVLPGVAVPIRFQQQTVGVLGIIGNPMEVERYIHFVQSHIEMLLIKKFQAKTTSLQMETMRDFIHQVIEYKNNTDASRLLSFSEMLGIQFNTPRHCILISFTPLDENSLIVQSELFLLMNNLFKESESDIVAPLNQNQWVILKHVQSNTTHKMNSACDIALESLNRYFKSKKLAYSILISYGADYSGIEGISKSYNEAKMTAGIAKQNNLTDSIYSISDWSILSLSLTQNVTLPSEQILISHIGKLKAHPNGDALIESFLTYCEQQLNMSKSARQLFIHRNTLLYRLKQLEEILEIDIHSFEQCILLYLALKRYRNLLVETV